MLKEARCIRGLHTPSALVRVWSSGLRFFFFVLFALPDLQTVFFSVRFRFDSPGLEPHRLTSNSNFRSMQMRES